MGETPNIVMQCPKCGRHFPLDQTYCEDCTAMLEPFETQQEGRPPSPEDQKAEADAAPAVTGEKIEDIKIDHLRADIENKFVYTLLLEIGQLRKRLQRKEDDLAGIQGNEGAGHDKRVSDAGKSEAAIDELLKKITKLEMTLDNLQQKIRDDISTLDAELGRLEGPGPLGFLNERGRYLRMLSSELKTKKLILEVIEGKKSPSALRLTGLMRPAVIVAAVAAGAIIFSLLIYTYPPVVPSGLRTTSREKSPAGNPVIISERDVNSLLDDIRTANLKKDLALWKSRYSRGYLASTEKKENIVEQWEKIDYKSLAFRLEDFQSGPAHASATVVWDVDFSPRKSTAIKKITQRLRADFAIEDDRLKITSVVKEES